MPATGAEQLRAIAAACKEVGDRGLMNRTRAAVRVAAAPIPAAAKENARQRLPHSGGLNEQVAGQRWTVQTLAGARTAGVRLRTTAPDTKQTDSGFVRHPTFGRRGKGEWRTQSIPQAAGWATEAVEKHGEAVAAAVLLALDSAAAEIARAGSL